jgi:nitrous oxidase accessory protein
MRGRRPAWGRAALLVSCVAGSAAAGVPVDDLHDRIDRVAEGGTILVPPGVYDGHLVVTKSVVLEGRGEVTIDGGGEGTVVELAVPGITFRGFTVRSSGETVNGEPSAIRALAGPVIIENNRIEDALFGIDLRESPDSEVRGNTVIGKVLELGRRGDGIRLWWSNGCVVEDNVVRGARDMVFWYSEGLSIARNHVTGSRYGLHFMYSHDTSLSDNTLIGNSVGVYLMYSNRITLTGNEMRSNRGASGYGIGLKDCDEILVENNALLANRVGLYIDNSPSSVDSEGLVVGNMLAFNEIGLLATPNTHDNVLTGNGFIENEEQVSVHGRGSLHANHFSREGTGNFWSDYAGFDRDGDGRGDLPYEPRSLFASLLEREPNLRFFLHSPAQQAIELTARAFPELRPEPKLVDESPLTRPPEVEVAMAGAHAGGLPMALLAVGLLAAVGCTTWWLGREQVTTSGDRADVSGRLSL